MQTRLKGLTNIGMNSRAIVRLISVICLVWMGVASADPVEEAWNSLLNPKHAKQAAFSYVKNDPELPNVLIYGDSSTLSVTPS